MKHCWWQTGVIYQVYPRSFQDSNGDGVGDIPGIIKRLDYLQWLGITILWLSPVYPSPMKDFGYDISDYTGIHPMFGSLADFDTLIKEVHARNMKLIIDHVPNHTSDQHPWFIESRSAKASDKRDWYIWADAAADGGPPNNWLSVFGGSAWEWDEKTGQYYYHAFLKEQPDLNFRNPAVEAAIYDVLRFWLNRGVDGFRIDVMWHLIKDKELHDNPPNPNYASHMLTYDKLLPVFSTDRPEVHDIVTSMRAVIDEYKERLLIGEIYLPVDKLMAYYGLDNKGAHLPFNFLLLSAPWNAPQIASIIDSYEASLPAGAWPNWVLGNHDQPRIRSRVGAHQARVAAMLLLTLRGTPTIYYGDELGMQDVPIPIEEQQDPQGLNMPQKDLSRDPQRTPMQWDASKYGGFSEARPWLRVDRGWREVNVAMQQNDDNSMLSLYRRLLMLRQREPALFAGSYKTVAVNRHGIAYLREAAGADRFLVALNCSHSTCRLSFKEMHKGTIEIATDKNMEQQRVEGDIYLSGDDGYVIRLDNDQ